MTETARTITMPQLGETVTEGTITRWLKNVGDRIEKYEPFAEVATDKVNAEIPAPLAGLLLEIFVAEGETVPTGAPIASIGIAQEQSTGESTPAGPEPASAPPAKAGPSSSDGISGSLAGALRSSDGDTLPGLPNSPTNSPAALDLSDHSLRLSPAVRRALRETQLDPRSIRGTGHEGRITLQDVETSRLSAPKAQPTLQSPIVHTEIALGPLVTRVPLTRARKTIAEHMIHATQTIPHAWTMVEVDVSGLVAKRHHDREKSRAQYGLIPTYFHYFSHTVVRVLARHPMMNARFGTDAIDVFGHVDLAFAIALESSLVVPVIRNAHALDFGQFAQAMAGVTDRARKGRLTIDELHGGTITVNNTGANGSILSQPIINSGQAAIITMESIVKRPVVVDGDAIAIRSMVNVCATIDHRVVDGDVVGAFLRDLKIALAAIA